MVVKLNLQAKNPDLMSIQIILIENEKILSPDEETAECFSNYFTNITDSLDIDPYFKEVPDQLTREEMVVGE